MRAKSRSSKRLRRSSPDVPLLPDLPNEVWERIFFKMHPKRCNEVMCYCPPLSLDCWKDLCRECISCSRQIMDVAPLIEVLCPLYLVCKTWNRAVRSFFSETKLNFELGCLYLQRFLSNSHPLMSLVLPRVSCLNFLFMVPPSIDWTRFPSSCVVTSYLHPGFDRVLRELKGLKHLFLQVGCHELSECGPILKRNALESFTLRSEDRNDNIHLQLKTRRRNIFDLEGSIETLRRVEITILGEWDDCVLRRLWARQSRQSLPDFAMFSNLEHVRLDVDNNGAFMLSSLKELKHLRTLELDTMQRLNMDLIWKIKCLKRLILHVKHSLESDVELDFDDDHNNSPFARTMHGLHRTAQSASKQLTIEIMDWTNDHPVFFPVVDECRERTGANIILSTFQHE